MRWFGFTPGAWVRGGEYSLLKLTAIILRTWRLMPAKMHPRWNRETWESQFYFTSRTLSGNVSRFAVDAGSRSSCRLALAAPSPDLFHQPHFVWEHESLPC